MTQSVLLMLKKIMTDVATPRAHPFAEMLNLTFSGADSPENSTAISRVKFDEKLLNPNGVVHGAVLYALADTGMGKAIQSTLAPGEISATIEIKITYLHSVSREDLVCESRVIKRGKRIAMLESEIFADERCVAKATGSFALFKPAG